MWTSATGSLDAFAAEKKVLAWLQNNAPAPFTTCHAKNFRCLCCAFSPVLPLCCVQSYRQRVRELANFFNVHCLQGVHIALSTTELLATLIGQLLRRPACSTLQNSPPPFLGQTAHCT